MKYTLFVLLSIAGFSLFSQTTKDLYCYKEITKAVKNETRTSEGVPGKNYFINQVDYKIKAEFDTKNRVLSGDEIISYKNNSNDTLELLVLNLYQDIFKKGNARDWAIGGEDIHNGVDIKKIKINGDEVDIAKKVYNSSSILRIKLDDLLLPNQSVKIEISWSYIFPATVHLRGGRYEKENYFFSYWFPKMAVYDDIVGWNTHGYTGIQEFYNDFGNYDVEITLPENYIAWSTGVLQNPEENFTDKIIERINLSKKTDSVVNIITKQDYGNKTVLKTKKSVWKFKSENTPDFAFAISKSYLWDAVSTQSGNRRVWVNVVYKPDSKEYTEVAEIAKNVIDFYTNEIPKVPYPYPQITVFNGGGGMEFPGMVNDGNSSTRNGTLYLTAHEIGHSYFPFYTGLNEQKYAWMDEGLITFFPQFFVEKYTKDSSYVVMRRNIGIYNSRANTMIDIPLMIPADNLSVYPYRFQAYNRSSVALNELYHIVGKETFVKALQEFIKNWNGKHPTPYDFFYTFNNVAGEDLAWFWKPWFFEMGSPDLSIANYDKSTREFEIINKTGFPVRVKILINFEDKQTEIYEYPAKVWTKKSVLKLKLPEGKVKSIELDTKDIPDSFNDDNIMKF